MKTLMSKSIIKQSCVVVLCAALLGPAQAKMQPVNDAPISVDEQALADLPLRSQSTATWLFIDVYNAYLYAPRNTQARTVLDKQTPLKLRLCYLHEISKEEFVEAASKALPQSLDAPLKQAVKGLHQAYQKVQPNDCYQLSYSPQQGVILSLNDKPVYQSKTPGFKELYFGIWLGKEPLSESVKEDLLEPLGNL
ncbi:Chalcone isomerase domain-containing protein [uncultured Thiomicrorhabdus sp.]